MQIRKEIGSHIIGSFLITLLLFILIYIFSKQINFSITISCIAFSSLSIFLLYFFRDPKREIQITSNAILSAADGKVTSITEMNKFEFMNFCSRSGLNETKMKQISKLCEKDIIRFSIFLSLMDVHVNRSPIDGISEFLGYYPGKHIFTFREKSSTENQHNAIYIHNQTAACLIFQIVGPIARRVVYWHNKNLPVKLNKGDKIGMMKFGSRLDMYFPKNEIIPVIKVGDKVTAGLTVIAEDNKGIK